MKHSCYYQELFLSLDPTLKPVMFGVAVLSSRGIKARFLPIEVLQSRIGNVTPALDTKLLTEWQEAFLEAGTSQHSRRLFNRGGGVKGMLSGMISGYSSVQIGEPHERACLDPEEVLKALDKDMLAPDVPNLVPRS